MTIIQGTLGDELLLDLSRACVELAEARIRRAERDSAAHRAVVAECHATIDSLLDMFLETAGSPEGMHLHPYR
jgi:hypothetical protein